MDLSKGHQGAVTVVVVATAVATVVVAVVATAVAVVTVDDVALLHRY